MRNYLKTFSLLTMILSNGPVWASGCHPQLHSNIGCEFYAVILPNPIAAEAEQLSSMQYDVGIALLNPSSSSATDITVTGGALVSAQSIHLAAGAHQSDALPKDYQLWQSTSTQTFTGGAYHIVATNPIVAVQFNTLSAASGSNDASLLLPVQSAGTSFRVVAWPTEILNAGPAEPSQVGIVATRPATTVQIQTLGNPLQAGAGLTTAGGTTILNNAGDVLILSASATQDSDLSGMAITSSAPILVWSSHSGAQVPFGTLAADHLEESLPPTSALGNDYLIARPKNPEGTTSGAKQYVKIVGTEDDTNLVFDSTIPGAPTTLQAGGTVTFEATVDFHVHADHRILVAQFMESGYAFGTSDTDGDPSETIAIPTEQAQLAVDFYAPQTFSPNYAQVIAPTGATIDVDGTVISGWTSLGTSGYAIANVLLCCTDAHHASGDQPFILSTYSYPAGYSSYWYPAAVGIGDDIFADGFE